MRPLDDSGRPSGDLRGAVRIDVRAAVRADPAEFVALALDLDQLRSLHPRLLDARWLDESAAATDPALAVGAGVADRSGPNPAAGSRAEIRVALPAALGLLTPIIGPPHGVLTLLDLRPARSVSYRLEADRVAGVVELIAHPDPATPAITVRGALWAKASLARAAMTPTLPLIGPAMTAAVHRTIARADELLLEGGAG